MVFKSEYSEKLKKSDDFNGKLHNDDASTSWLGHLVTSQSMDITNDPRFFQDNVLNYRLSAFNGLAVVSGLMVGNAMGQVFDMNKVMNLNFNDNTPKETFEAICLCVSFVILVYILFVMMFAIYVGVCQPYHTYRLMTSGPHGFEAAAHYYLNPMLVWLRHTAIKGMFGSLPLYLLQMAIRIIVKFDDDTKQEPELPEETPLHSKILGISFASLFFLAGLALLVIHISHTRTFAQTYAELSRPNLTAHMQGILRSMNHNHDLDV